MTTTSTHYNQTTDEIKIQNSKEKKKNKMKNPSNYIESYTQFYVQVDSKPRCNNKQNTQLLHTCNQNGHFLIESLLKILIFMRQII